MAETEPRSGGRRAVTLGIDVGGTKILGVALDPSGRVLSERRSPSPDGLDALVDSVAGMIDDLRSAHAPGAIGVGVAGLVDDDGVVRYAPNIPGLRDAPIQARLAQRTDLPVVVDNDANVAGWGEATHGAAAGARHVLLVTLGTGIGGAIVLDGSVYRGAHGFAAEIGHITVVDGGPRCACGELGHWEAIASGSALGRMARELAATDDGAAVLEAAGGDVARVDGEHVEAAARAGDAPAGELFRRFADNVALGLAGLANVLDPEVVVVSGGLVELGALLFEPLGPAFAAHLEAASHRPHIPVLPAVLGERAGAIGAAVLAGRAR